MYRNQLDQIMHSQIATVLTKFAVSFISQSKENKNSQRASFFFTKIPLFFPFKS